ncbi:hypothetical protein [Parasitella parasitica]|uniref:Uncharacterized protein n=1 Tax=Parasitella parasitica TaxID=35722 RepID=A0A0B7N4Z8_9FUNG|nr:hypothetical protein [Parasitella parasitica]
MNCLTSTCTPIAMNIVDPSLSPATFCYASSTTATSSPSVERALLSSPSTSVSEVWRFVLDRTPALFPATAVEESPVVSTGGWDHSFQEVELPGSNWIIEDSKDTENIDWTDEALVASFLKQRQQQIQEDAANSQLFIFNNVQFNNNGNGEWADEIREYYEDSDDAASVISLLAGRYELERWDFFPSPPFSPLNRPVQVPAVTEFINHIDNNSDIDIYSSCVPLCTMLFPNDEVYLSD